MMRSEYDILVYSRIGKKLKRFCGLGIAMEGVQSPLLTSLKKNDTRIKIYFNLSLQSFIGFALVKTFLLDF